MLTEKGTPRLEAQSVWEIYAQSGMRHLLLTGSRGAGKSSVLEKLPLPPQTPRLVTRAVPGKGIWMQAETKIQIGKFTPETDARAGNRMKPLREGLSRAAESVRTAAGSRAEYALLDEIGYLESENAEYGEALDALFRQKRVMAAVRKQLLPFLQRQLERPEALVVDLDAPAGKTACIIMGSGTGQRFGGGKLMADFLGKPLLAWTLQAAEGIFGEMIVVTRTPQAAELAESYGAKVILHTLPTRSEALHLGVAAVSSGMAGAVFCPADQPLLQPHTLLAVGAAVQSCPECIWRAGWNGRAGAPAGFGRQFFAELKSLSGTQGGKAVMERHTELLRSVQANSKEELDDIDTQEDLLRLKKRILGN